MQAASLPNGPSQASASGGEVIARINGQRITMNQVRQPLLEAYGLNVLLNVVQLELAKNEAQKLGVSITPSDVEEERLQTTERLFKGSEADSKMTAAIDAAEVKKDNAQAERLKTQLREDRERMLLQFLEQQKVSRPEFELVLQTNTYLRKIAEPQLKGKITDEQLHAAFDAEYGASVVVRHIAGTPQGLATARKRIEAGERFEDVAKVMSSNKMTAALGGEMKKFTLANPMYPDHFKRLAFDLKEGEISEVVEAGNTYHILKLVRRIPPKAVTFESVRDSVKARLYDSVMQAAVKTMRDSLAMMARRDLKIDEPMLRNQFQKKLDDSENVIRGDKMRDEMEKERIQAQPNSAIPQVGADAPTGPPGPVKPETPAPAGDLKPAFPAAAPQAAPAKPQAPAAPAGEAKPSAAPADGAKAPASVPAPAPAGAPAPTK